MKDFKLSNFIYISDGGLNSNETRLYNSFGNRDYIVTQSLKKLKKVDQDLILTDDNWQSLSTGKLKSISTIKDDEDTYYKVMWIDNPIDVGLSEMTQSGKLKKKTNFKQISYKINTLSKFKNQIQRTYITGDPIKQSKLIEKSYDLI